MQIRGINLNNRLEGHSSPTADVTSAKAVNIFDDEIKQKKEDKKMKHKIKTEKCIVDCLFCGEEIVSDNWQQYCNDDCEDKSDMDELDKIEGMYDDYPKSS